MGRAGFEAQWRSLERRVCKLLVKRQATRKGESTRALWKAPSHSHWVRSVVDTVEAVTPPHDHPSHFPFTRLIMVESGPNEFFPKIGKVVERTDALEDRELSGQTKGEDDQDRAVEEIESLCMSCGEQVRDRADLRRAFYSTTRIECRALRSCC